MPNFQTMKTRIKIALLFLCMVASVFAQQKALIVEVSGGTPQIEELSKHLAQGWKVVVATPVADSDSMSLGSKPKQSYTDCIVYILEKD